MVGHLVLDSASATYVAVVQCPEQIVNLVQNNIQIMPRSEMDPESIPGSCIILHPRPDPGSWMQDPRSRIWVLKHAGKVSGTFGTCLECPEQCSIILLISYKCQKYKWRHHNKAATASPQATGWTQARSSRRGPYLHGRLWYGMVI